MPSSCTILAAKLIQGSLINFQPMVVYCNEQINVSSFANLLKN
jgi:hypothetical protein